MDQTENVEENQLIIHPENEKNLVENIFNDLNQFEKAQRIGKMFANSNFTPTRFKGNIGDCVIALDMASRLNMSPITILQECYIVHGSPGFSSKFIIALINNRGGYAQDLQFCETATDCYAWTVNKQGDKLSGPLVTIDMARKEGWLDKSGSKWQTMPQIMLRYRAASFFAKSFCPNLLMGMQSKEELFDAPIEKDITPKPSIKEKINNDKIKTHGDKLKQAVQGKPNG